MATQTTNYHFPKYEADDLPNLLDEYNEFADLADAAINNAMMTATNAGTAAQNAKTAADAASTKADDVEDTVNTLSVQVTTAQSTADNALSLAQTNESDIAGIDSQIETANQSISSLQAGKAPTNHASASSTYGPGTATNYGHVRLSDSASSGQTAASGIAATPAAVQAARDYTDNRFAMQQLYSGNLPLSGSQNVTAGSIDVAVFAMGTSIIAISADAGNDPLAFSQAINATWTINYTLPEQYRPSRRLEMPIYCPFGVDGFAASGGIRIDPDGTITFAMSSNKENRSYGIRGNVMFLVTTGGGAD